MTGNNVGITILAGTSSSYSLANNIFTGNVANAIVDGGTGTTKSVSKNIGYNPVANTAITVTASPFSYTNNSGETQNVYVTGGTVSSVTVDGKQVAAAGNIVAAVPQKAAMVVTYTVAPTMSASGY